MSDPDKSATIDDLQQAGVENLKRRMGVKPKSRREQEREQCEQVVRKLVVENAGIAKYCSAMNAMHPQFSATNAGILARALFDAYRREDALRDLIRLAEAPSPYGPAAGVNTIDVAALKRILDGPAPESPRLKDGVEHG